MIQPLIGKAMLELCETVEERICNTNDCEHLGRSCDAPGCDNYFCKLHERYCGRCEQQYCEDCWEIHLEACSGPEADAYDERVEQALSEALPAEPGRKRSGA